MGRDNYASARGLLIPGQKNPCGRGGHGYGRGPTHTGGGSPSDAAALPDELCPGPLAAIDEGDKIRTIYDGSWGHANSHVQQNTVEKTTAPTSCGLCPSHPLADHHEGENYLGR